ncbi:17703_t:CDS:10, partial [Racocetra persica]
EFRWTYPGDEFTPGNEQEHDTSSISLPKLPMRRRVKRGLTKYDREKPDIRYVREKPDIRYVVALEIGTTHSGFAYASRANPENITNDTNFHQKSSEDIVKNYGPEQTGVFKTNTVVAYDENLQPVAWGYPALIQEPLKKKGALAKPQLKPVELFMLHLIDLREDDKPPLPPGIDAKRVITDYLHEMNKPILDTLSTRWPIIQYPQQVRFVLPVPDHWGYKSKAIMRECMYNAGYLEHRQSENLEFITVSEAAAIYCLKTMNEYHLSVGSSILIVDCEGGTVDLTTRTLLPRMLLGEVTERSGDLCGSSYVDREFLKFLGRKLGFAAMKKLKENHYEQMQYLVQQFCLIAKFSFNGNPYEYTSKELDIELICPSLMQYVTGKARELMEESEWLIDLDYQTVKDMFDPVLKKIIDLIQRHCISTERRCAAMFLVGDFSEIHYLQSQIRRQFATQIPIIAAPKQPTAGALEYGLNITRTLKYGLNITGTLNFCYGIEISVKWERHDPPERCTPSGHIFRFHRLALRGTEVAINQIFYYTFAVDPNQTDMVINVFTTMDNNAKYCDEDGMKMLGNIKIDLSDLKEQKKLLGFTLKKKVVEVEFILTFGAAEIIAMAINKKTGKNLG